MLLDGGAVEKPMLGRYQVEKELGKGAMGVVYLGKDPKIGRVVAIKTMALSQEFEGEENWWMPVSASSARQKPPGACSTRTS
jgi:serine/threonine protein kinase